MAMCRYVYMPCFFSCLKSVLIKILPTARNTIPTYIEFVCFSVVVLLCIIRPADHLDTCTRLLIYDFKYYSLCCYRVVLTSLKIWIYQNMRSKMVKCVYRIIVSFLDYFLLVVYNVPTKGVSFF